MSGPLFGLIPAGLPLITDPSSTPSPTSLLYALPSHRAFSHLVAAAERSGALPPFKFLGAIGPGKESAMFKVGNTNSNTNGGDASEAAAHHSLVIGVSIEAEADVAQKMQELVANKNSSSSGSTQQQPSTVVLAQRIIQNAFNFLTGFSGTAGPGGVEVVPLKAFEEWWRKFENRVRNDPSFLEKQSD
ncbi:Protein OPI10 [Beauveria bassiana D1-5]|uniref:Protein OPI10 n=1 Tax=Beauveria bassiana D1-5 TaxID=1245745 RepID=A0A0A2WA49_BEABA|nr:Protein OPI10 [Beauveria bassiana D1-5]